MNEFEKYRNYVWSSVKCEAGWNGCLPLGCSFDRYEILISQHFASDTCARDVAQMVADDLANEGAVFRERTDSKPNFLVLNRSVQ